MKDNISLNHTAHWLGSRIANSLLGSLAALPGQMTSRQASVLILTLSMGLITSEVGAQGPAARPFLISPSAAADQALKAVLTQRKVVRSSNGVENFEDASTVKPGDVIEYQVVYTNSGSKPVNALVADLPIPDGLSYQPRSAKPGPAKVQAATNDGIYGAEPLNRNVGGKLETVPYSEYRHLRWSLGQVPANGKVAVTARAQVETVVQIIPSPPEQPRGEPETSPSRSTAQ